MGLLPAHNGGTSCTAAVAVGNQSNTPAAAQKKSTSCSFVANSGDCKSNAAFDRPIVTMAPAVTEPLSPTEKLVSSTATPTPTPTTTRANSKKHQQDSAEASDTTTATHTNTHPTPTPASGERKVRHGAAITATTSTRLTRSKDAISAVTGAGAAYQSIFEKTVTTLSPNSAINTGFGDNCPPKTKPNIRNNNNNINNNNNNKGGGGSSSNSGNKNAQMGLSAAPAGNKKHNNNNKINDNNNKKSGGGSGSSCSIISVNVNNTSSGVTSPTVAHSTPLVLNCRDDTSTAQLLADLTDDFEEAITAEICLRKQLVEVKGSATDSPTSRSSSSARAVHMATPAKVPAAECPDQQEHDPDHDQQEHDPEDAEADLSNDTEELSFEERDGAKTAESQSDASATQLEMQSVDELPPISTDSTMTASEAEDNLEERLSVLDGSTVESLDTRDTRTAGAALATGLCEMVPATPPRTPQHQQQLHDGTHLLLSQPSSACVAASSSAATTSAMATSGAVAAHQTPDIEDTDIMEVFKVLNTLDSTAGTEALTELNSLFNEVYTTLNCDEMAASGSGHHQPHSQLHAGPIGMSTVALSPVKPNPLQELHVEIERKQLSMQRKIDFLLRRLRKTQARHMCKHASDEISGLFEYFARGSNAKIARMPSQLAAIKSGMCAPSGSDSGAGGSAPAIGSAADSSAVDVRDADGVRLEALTILASRPPAKIWSQERRTLVSSSQVCSFLRKLEASATAQQHCTAASGQPGGSNYYSSSSTPGRRPRKADAIPSSSAAVAAAEARPQVVPTLDGSVAEELAIVSGLLRSSLREVQLAVDSDATESSSGGESADEMISYNNEQQQSLDITKRAAWRYSRDRAAIAARWSWLHSQIADLEIKIRQHSELHQEIVRTKHLAAYERSGTPSEASASPVTMLMKDLNMPTSVNGFKGDLSLLVGSGSGVDADEADDPNALPGSCRTRGYCPEQFRKRKLLQTTHLHTISKKAARPSTVKCGCQWPQQPCSLCTGRADPTAPRDLYDTMMKTERVGLVDDSFHPVLSFPEDIGSTLHFEAIARQPEFQQRAMRCQVKSIAKSVMRAEREAIALAASASLSKKYNNFGEPLPPKRRYIKKKDRINEEQRILADGSKAPSLDSPKQEAKSPASSGAAGADVDGGGNGNGTGSMTAPSGTPLVVANRLAKNGKKLNHMMTANGQLLETPSPPTSSRTRSNSSRRSRNRHIYMHQTSECPPPSYVRSNRSRARSSLISSKNNRYRKNNAYFNSHLSNSAGRNNNTSRQHQHKQNNHQHYSNNNNNNSKPTQCYTTVNGGGAGDPTSYLQASDSWDYLTGRSRPASPTPPHGGSNHLSKGDRLYDRKTRSSYEMEVVIPYSLAGSTRAEVLPYKEIPTPKWRVIDIDKVGDDLDNDDSAAAPKDVAALKEDADAAVKSPDDIAGDAAPKSDVNQKPPTAAVKVEEETVETEDEKAAMPDKPNSQEASAPVVAKNETDAASFMDVDEPQAATPTSPLPPAPLPAQSIASEVKKSCDEPPTKRIKFDGTVTAQSTTAHAQSTVVKQATAVERPIVVKPAVAVTKAARKQEASPDIIVPPIASKDWRPGGRSVGVVIKPSNDELELEDISNEAMVLRHERALAEERRKFQTFLKFPWSTRSRANRRIDSRAESSGANTPDPTSPAPQTPVAGAGDPESISSPLTNATPSLEAISEAIDATNALHAPTLGKGNGSSRNESRRRTTSAKKGNEMDGFNSTSDPKELPYEPLRFPLPDDVYEALIRSMPSEYQLHNSKYSDGFDDDTLLPCISPLMRVTRNSCGIVTSHIVDKKEMICDQDSSGTTAVVSGKKPAIATVTSSSNTASATTKPYVNGMGASAAEVETDADADSDFHGIDDEAVEQAEEHVTAPDVDDDDDDDGDGEDDDEDDDDDDVDEEDDEEEDEYPRHPLAPHDDPFDLAAVADPAIGDDGALESLESGAAGTDIETPSRALSLLSDSDGETDIEPFQDDDPNDPEWKGGSGRRTNAK